MKRIHECKNKYSHFFDLKKVLEKKNNFSQKIEIYYSSKHCLDRIHAERLKEFKKIKLHAYINGGHTVVKTLKDSGELSVILSKIFK